MAPVSSTPDEKEDSYRPQSRVVSFAFTNHKLSSIN